jgi:hypothetical protein
VDPKSVTVSKLADAKTVGAPKPATDLRPGTYRYDANIAMGSQKVALKVSTTIKEENGAWTVTDSVETPMGPATDTATIEKGTLIVQKRTSKEGAATIVIDFAGNKAAGTMSMNGQEMPISVDLGGPLFADSAGAPQAIACLPLAEGYSTSFRNFDPQKQKVKLMQLKVTGSESVTVPAGTFDAFKVELSSADGGADKGTLWVAKDSHQAVKMSVLLPQMGGATLTTELMP